MNEFLKKYSAALDARTLQQNFSQERKYLCKSLTNLDESVFAYTLNDFMVVICFL